MKKILITGANSYIGMSFEKYIKENYSADYSVDTVDMIDGSWREKSFAEYDSVFHVAGIAHKKETKENAHLYYEVNEHLAVAVAKKAKNEGVKQFVILSTMSVYGLTVGHITKETKPTPLSNYGKAKYNADLKIEKLNCSSFKVAILRPPMVYGKGCKGNYQTLRKFALKIPVFPNYANRRSMLYVGNLSVFVKELIDTEKSGLFFPQDAEYVCTTDMVKRIADYNDKSIRLTRAFNWAISIALRLKIGVVRKVFGSLTYESVDLVKEYTLEQTMKWTEN